MRVARLSGAALAAVPGSVGVIYTAHKGRRFYCDRYDVSWHHKASGTLQCQETGGCDGHILVLCAMPVEAKHLKEQLQDKVASKDVLPSVQQPWPCTIGKVGNATVKLVECGMGLAHAAAAASAHIICDRPRAVLNYGCAGAHVESLQPGDCIIGTQVKMMDAQHVYSISEGRTDITADRNFGETHADCSSELVAIARKAASQIHLPRNPKASRDPEIIEGVVGSSETWQSDVQGLRNLRALHCTSCEDMEAAAIAAVCKKLGVPFLCVKDIANNDLVEVTTEAMLTNGMGHWIVSKESAAIIVEVLRLIGQGGFGNK